MILNNQRTVKRKQREKRFLENQHKSFMQGLISANKLEKLNLLYCLNTVTIFQKHSDLLATNIRVIYPNKGTMVFSK